MKKYEAYKNSGVEWIGEIPEGWTVAKVKNILHQSKDGIKIGPFGSSLTGKVDTKGDFKVYGQWNIVGKDFTAGRNYISKETYNSLDSYIIVAGDILVSMMGTVGKCAIIPKGIEPGIMDSHVVKVRLDIHKMIPSYFEYVYDKDNSNVIFSQIQKYRRGSIMDGLNSTLIKEFTIPLPTLPEQQAIASYLDHKVGQIDASVSALDTQIDDLKAYRQSVISEAVTKGLNPNAPMKDSGIEWIGEIPEGWEITKLGWAYPNMGSGTTPDSNNLQYYVEEGYNWLQTGDLTDGAITSTSKHLSQIAVDEKRMRFYPIGSIVIAMYGATIGKVGYLEIETSTNQACCVLPPQENMDNRFMFYMMQSSKTTLISKSVGGGQPNISQAIIQEHRIPVPSLSEQQTIASYLDSKTPKVDATIASLEAQRDDLNALKQSVISEAVTGKIDVRDWHKNQ